MQYSQGFTQTVRIAGYEVCAETAAAAVPAADAAAAAVVAAAAAASAAAAVVAAAASMFRPYLNDSHVLRKHAP